MDALADPAEVDAQAKVALEHYRNHYEAGVAAKKLLEIFHDFSGRARTGNVNR
jgi:hypothetical protein